MFDEGSQSYEVVWQEDFKYFARFYVLYTIKNVMLSKELTFPKKVYMLILFQWPLYDSNSYDIGSTFKLSLFYLGNKRLLIVSHYTVGKHIYEV